MALLTSRFALAAVVICLTMGYFGAPSAMALTARECGAKYQTAKAANTLGGLNYNAFRQAQCGTEPAPAAAAAAPAAPPAQPTAAPANPLRPQPAAVVPKPAPAAALAAVTGPVAFPKAVDPKYSTLSAGQQRLKTCADQYNANKATNSNGGMKWIEKGGGYWSACNKAIKA